MVEGPGYRRGVPLRDRSVVTAGGEPVKFQEAGSGAAPSVPAQSPPAPRQRHCWVKGPAEALGPHPGLLLEWRLVGAGEWRALVAYAVVDGDQVTLVQQWVPAELVRPVERA
jgi:hypothetical protein